MKAVQIPEAHKMQIIDVGEPPSPKPGEALVRVHRVGICGSDYSGFLGKMPFYSYPRIFGHELGVEILEVGNGVTNVRPGDRASVEPYVNCRECIACRSGNSNCCQHNQTLGVHCDGGLCSRYIVRADKLHCSTVLDYEQLALVETLGIGCHAVKRAAVSQGETVLIVGAGPIGLGAIEFARIAGARVVVVDLSHERLEFCRREMAIEHTLLPDAQLEQQLLELTDGEGAPVVIDATGSASSMSLSLDFASHTGRVVFLGLTTADISFQQKKMHAKELTLLASRNSLPDEFRYIIGRIESGELTTDHWITHRLAFNDLPTVFPTLLKPDSGVIKAIVEVPED